jgi:L-fuconolactonase
MLIADAQIHVWGASTPERPWPADAQARTHRAEPLGADEVLAAMDEAGVDRAVLVPPSYEGDYNDLALAAAADHPDRFAVMGRITLTDPANAALLPGWKRQKGMLGVRLTFNKPGLAEGLRDGRFDWFWKGAEAAGIPVMCLPVDLVPEIDRVAERHPGLRLIIDHLAMNSSKRDGSAFAALDQVVTLARRPNVAVKASALPCYTPESYPFRGIQDHIKRVFDAFGPRRMFWGSDLSRLPCTYRQCITHFTEELPFLKGEDLERVMGRALCDWIGWTVAK